MKWKEALVAGAMASVIAVAISWATSPPFPTAWTSAYEAIPADTEQESLGASRIRDLKTQLRLRLSQDHSWAGDGNDGFHKTVTLLQQTTDPTPQFDSAATAGVLYTKLVGSTAELFYKNSTGTVQQLTTGGQLNITTTLPGTVLFTAGVPPAGWDVCDGSAHSRTTEAALFAVIGTTYGAGDGVSTFNVPDARGRAIFGADPGDITGRVNTIGGAIANTGGNQVHTMALAELAAHTHGATVTDPGHAHQVSGSTVAAGIFPAVGSFSNGGGNPGSSSTNLTGISVAISNTGSNQPFGILPPLIFITCIIKR